MVKDMIIKTMSFKVWQTLTIVGVPKAGISDFKVNICPDEKDIAMHINPRFDGYSPNNVVVCNSYQGGNWDEEVRGSSFPFEYEKEFMMIIKFTPAEFQVTLPDGSKIHFPNRFGAGRYPVIKFEKDVCISRVEIS
uniref:beta-galactoside-binding lectin-like n=1 Tax=Scatophagus argus TaxID=75038 RepID=UPI001ED80B96|nr:beta-galactoside-binding lectin-like [Scatophagus argus]XP_046271931.1 beta-galactoside-binding lectin-like [Scatophagus argus]XP_046272174.1 beta-galactoside-binding lectin-like [Scatophagus argus]